MHAERGHRIRVRHGRGRGGFAGPSASAARRRKTGLRLQAQPSPIRLASSCAAGGFPNDNIDHSGRVRMADLALAPDIDFVRGVVMVTRALTQHSKAAESTKTNAGRREVKLPERALHALQEQKTFTLAKGEEVFQNPRLQRRWERDQPIRKTLWTGILQNAGVRYRNPYQTRHTYASMMLSAGEHPMWVAKQMGHADWTMIARVYGRWMPDADLMSGQRPETIFGIKK